MEPQETTTSRERTARRELEPIAREVRTGLQGDPPSLPTKLFYDDRGSELFERITRLPEYYQTRTEERLLEGVAGEVVSICRPRELVELGSGAGRKIRLLLDVMGRDGFLRSCILFDINRLILQESTGRLARSYPDADFRGVSGDFLKDLSSLEPAPARMVILLASTIGNIHPRDVPSFLFDVRGILKREGWFLVGLDVVKERERLEAAYNDSAGVTAEFNRNILRVINRRLDADFPVREFDHVAFWDPQRSWIEMRLRAARDMKVSVPGARMEMELDRGDEIRTEISCKYTRESFSRFLEGTGFELARWFTDAEHQFALALLRAV
jgi:L-histidine N-alpha-methyltransferase